MQPKIEIILSTPPPSTDTVPARGHSRFHGIVLAAGAGRRFGGGKMLGDWSGRPLILAAVEAALAAPVETVTVVLGHQATTVREVLGTLEAPRLQTIECSDWQAGQSASLRAGVLALPKDAEGVVVYLGDMPIIPVRLAGILINAVASGAPAATATFNGGPAHPVVFARPMFPALVSLSGDHGARSLLDGVDGVARVATSDIGSVFDIDTREDLERTPVLNDRNGSSQDRCLVGNWLMPGIRRGNP